MYKKVFRRDEKKYLLTPQQKQKFLAAVRDHLMRDKYFQSTICSLYFDTPHYDLIVQSLEKPLFKQKLRLRSYDVPSLDDTVFLEIKIKYDGIVNKRRIKVNLRDFYNYYAEHSKRHGPLPADKSLASPQITRELDYLFRLYDLQPSVLIAYDRESYCDRENPNLRITFDQNLRSRSTDLRLEHGDHGQRYFDDGRAVMEIKALEAMPLWLVQTLSDLQIYPASFTKYGRIYEKMKGVQNVK